MMTANFETNCHDCVPWRTFITKKGKTPEAMLDESCFGRALPDPKLDLLCTFARKLIEHRGHPGDETLGVFLSAGYAGERRRRGLGVMSKFTNDMTHTRLDNPPKQFEWTKPRGTART